MIKTKIILGETLKQYEIALNEFYMTNKTIEIIDIYHTIRSFDDYIAIITYKELEIE